MKQLMLKSLKTIFSDVRKVIIGTIFLALVGGTGGLLYLSKSALSVSTRILNKPILLWQTIVLVLICCIYFYIRQKKLHSSETHRKIKYFEFGCYKWKAEIYKNNYFKLDETPLCLKHDLLLRRNDYFLYCPEINKKNCSNRIVDSDFYDIYKTAESYIDRQIRNDKY